MRVAIVSDIHGNRTAFEAVLADLRHTAPDLILHGGDLADSGASPAQIVDRVRDLGWPGVLGNKDEMLAEPESLTEFAKHSPKLQPLFEVIAKMAAATRELLGEERLAWLRGLPLVQTQGPLALVHAGPASAWRAPSPEASEEELEKVYGPLGHVVNIYAHIHRPYIRTLASGRTIANTGSVSLSYDGDTRASYLLLDDAKPTIRRVAYDLATEIAALVDCGLPHVDWLASMLKGGCFKMP